MGMTSLVVLVDYHNVAAPDRNPSAFVRNICSQLPATSADLDVSLRVYGGWYDGQATTNDRHDAAIEYQACPTLMKVGATRVRTRVEFADRVACSPIGGPSWAISHTVVRRAAPQSLRLVPGAPACELSGCELATVRRWVKHRRGCSSQGCPHPFDTMFFRRDQKQVDVHLASDLIALAASLPTGVGLAVASDDVDFAPALFSARFIDANRAIFQVRSRARKALYCDTELLNAGILIINQQGAP